MPLYIAQSGDLDRCNGCLTDGQTLKDSATQLLIKYKVGMAVRAPSGNDNCYVSIQENLCLQPVHNFEFVIARVPLSQGESTVHSLYSDTTDHLLA